jgi:hypothetical protein
MNGEVTKYVKTEYNNLIKREDMITYALDGTPIEYNVYDASLNADKIYDWKTKKQYNIDKLIRIEFWQKYNDLTDEVKELLKDFEYKIQIDIYAEKPYGKVVYVFM